jgi:hypothetical protein
MLVRSVWPAVLDCQTVFLRYLFYNFDTFKSYILIVYPIIYSISTKYQKCWIFFKRYLLKQ